MSNYFIDLITENSRDFDYKEFSPMSPPLFLQQPQHSFHQNHPRSNLLLSFRNYTQHCVNSQQPFSPIQKVHFRTSTTISLQSENSNNSPPAPTPPALTPPVKESSSLPKKRRKNIEAKYGLRPRLRH